MNGKIMRRIYMTMRTTMSMKVIAGQSSVHLDFDFDFEAHEI